MPEYLAPGVFIEEVSYRSNSIEGVSTSVAGLVGPTSYGPLRGQPEVVTSFREYERIYGGLSPLTFGATRVPNHSALAANAFFDQGGKQLYVVRVLGGVNAGTVDSAGSSSRARSDATITALQFSARFPGAYGNFTLELRFRDTQSLIAYEQTSAREGGVIRATLPAAAFVGATLPAAQFPVSLEAFVAPTSVDVEGTQTPVLQLAAATARITDKDGEQVSPDQVGNIRVDQVPADLLATTSSLIEPSSGALADGDLLLLSLRSAIPTELLAWFGSVGELVTLIGSYDADAQEVTFGTTLNALSADVVVPIARLAPVQNHIRSVSVLRTFDLDVRKDGAGGEVIRTYADCAATDSGAQALTARMPETPTGRDEFLSSPIACVVASGSTRDVLLLALLELVDSATLVSADARGPRFLITLTGGSDGDAPRPVDYAGEVDEVIGNTGLAALEDIEEVSMVMTPHASTLDDSDHTGVVMELQQHCRRMRYRIGLIDSREGMALSEVRRFGDQFDDSLLALYYPWVVISDPTGEAQEVATPPSGFMAGLCASNDVRRGVHKTPANEVVLGALRFETPINSFQQELLNPNGVNCLRSFPRRGNRVWGGRTRSSDPEWKYLSVRRYFLYLEHSIERATQWVVFEPNGESLWESVRQTVDSFLFNEWSNKRLLGTRPTSAYFVQCDRTTMTQNDIDNGRLVCRVGVAPLRPAEFVVFRIGQKTADS